MKTILHLKLDIRALKVATALIMSLLCLEIVLRIKFGFCATVLLREDPNYEYIAIPQETTRFGSYSFYNKYSQRNGEITSEDSLIILGFGDSVLNGGVLTTQDSLATSQLTKFLAKYFNRSILVTNIAAGSWGPDNSFAYLRKNGNFKAKLILLQVSSHDAYDNMDFEKVVGINSSYPDKQYKLAIWELMDRYVLPRLGQISFKKKQSNNIEDLRINKYKKGALFNTGFKNFKAYSDSSGIPLIVFLHAEKAETIAKKYNSDGQKIINFCKDKNIMLIQELDFPFPATAYRDKIHLTNEGQRLMFEVLKEPLSNSMAKLIK